jgi:predicted dienelactone hydrolase
MTPVEAEAWDSQAAALGLSMGNTPFSFSYFQMEVCDPKGSSSAVNEKKKFPLVLYEPGFGNSRLEYGFRAMSLASQGFVVVTVDHPYDAAAVQFPDGTIVRGANLSDSDPRVLEKVVDVSSSALSP